MKIYIPIWFHGQRLHLCRHIRFGDTVHTQDIEVFIGVPSLPLINETFLTEEQHTRWIDGPKDLCCKSTISCQWHMRRCRYEYKPTQKHFFYPQVVYAQRYSNCIAKVFPFTNHNIESMLIPGNLLQLWSKAGGSHGRANHVERLVTDAGKASYAESKSESTSH